jgi:hypothetical protein
MEVVINKCYGGFSLSKKAVARLAELNGKKAYFFEMKGLRDKYIEIPMDKGSGMFFTAFSIPNPNEYFADEKDWFAMTDKEKKESNERYSAVELSTRPEDRTDPKLVQVVRELGKEANGSCADLAIVTIPDGIEWHIDEYDGIERIAEDHRTWA